MSRKSRGHAEGHGGEEAWVIPYADLITLLLGFFILLYATADANTVKMEALARGLSDAFNVSVREGNAGDSIFNGGTGVVPGHNSAALVDFDLERIQRTIEELSAQAGVTGQIMVTRDLDRITIRLADNLLFPSASADIRPDARPLLQIVAEAVNQADNEIRVEGHTDNIPLATDRYPSNWELSSARATAVLRVLTEDLGVEAGRTFAAGYGEHRPIASNLTGEGRALNRRADIVLLYPAISIGQPLSALSTPSANDPIGSDQGVSDQDSMQSGATR
ncbi:MAG: OmpA family protein [Dehalococcoidia bacterium]